MSAATSPPDLPPPPPPSGQWAYPTNEKGEPKKNYVLLVVFGAAGCFVLIVVAGLLLTVLVPNLIRSFTRGQTAKAQVEIEELCLALGTYAQTHDQRYPETLEALVQPDENGHTLWRNERELPRDPWGRAYQYTPPTPGEPIPDVYSLGHDGLPGGRGADEDIHSIYSLRGKR